MEIYVVRILDVCKEMVDELCLLVDEEKRYKIKKFINKEDRIRTLIGDVLVRLVVMKNLEIDKRNIVFSKNDYGKPYLKEHPEFNFNISHSGSFVVCAIDDKPIGIDIEQIKHIEYEEIAKNFFSASEVDYITKKDSENKLSRFYEIWTLKESYVKCYGQGLSIPLEQFSIDIDEYENIKLSINNEKKEYSFKRFDINDSYKMAICSVKKEIQNDITMIDQNYLINNCIFGEDP